MFKNHIGLVVAGALAGSITGLLGAGGGMVLIPLLTLLTKIKDEEVFPVSVAIILPVCIVSLFFRAHPLPLQTALPYLIGSAAGGILAGILAKRIPTLWLHRFLGIIILWGGIRYLC